MLPFWLSSLQLAFGAIRAGALPISWPVSTFVVSAISLYVLPNWGWRGLFFVFVVPALLAFWIRRNVPESPRWLANRGRFAEARKALNYLQISDEAIERSRIAVQNEPPLPMLPTAVFRDLFTPQMRRRTIHVWLLWLLPQMAGWGLNVWLPKLFMHVRVDTQASGHLHAVHLPLLRLADAFWCTS